MTVRGQVREDKTDEEAIQANWLANSTQGSGGGTVLRRAEMEFGSDLNFEKLKFSVSTVKIHIYHAYKTSCKF